MNLVMRISPEQVLWEDYGIYLVTSFAEVPTHTGDTVPEILAFVADYKGTILKFRDVYGSRFVANTLHDHEAIALKAFQRPAKISEIFQILSVPKEFDQTIKEEAQP